MAQITTTDLIEAGVHFGHQTRRWNPKMKNYIMASRNGIYIIDLMQTVDGLNKAYDFVKDLIARGGSILFVGTKKQAQNEICSQATRVGQPYVSERWLGGMLTNFGTISKRLTRLKELEGMNFESATNTNHTKKELLLLEREKNKLEKVLGGIKDVKRVPDAVFIVDTNKEHLAIDEAHKLGIPVVAIADTNCNPDEIDYIIPGNDDAIRSVSLITKLIADAVAAGLLERSTKMAKTGTETIKEASGDVVITDTEGEALADWEKELLNAN
jgi:small subunit ribosomal protein S2